MALSIENPVRTKVVMTLYFEARRGNCQNQSPRIFANWCRLLMLMAFGTLSTGCAESTPPTAHLQGAVTIHGAPIPGDATAFINFAPAAGSGSKSVSVPVTGGRYDSPETPVGNVKVSFDISRPVGPEKKSERTGQMYRDIAGMVPAQYATGMQLEIKADNPKQDFHLTD